MRRVIRTGFGRGSIPREVDDELAFHLEMRARQLIGAGLSPDEARREALRQFGNLDEVRASCVAMDRERIRTMNRVSLLQDLRQDAVYALRVLRRNLGVTTVVVASLALGIGANTAIFSLINAVLLRKLPVRAPDELVVVGNPSWVNSMSYATTPQGNAHSYRTYLALRDRDDGLVRGLLATGRADRLLVHLDGGRGEPDRPRGRYVSGNYFHVLGVPAFLGRTFDGTEDETTGGAPVATVSHRYWTNRLGGDSAAVGRDVVINGARFTIIGVTPPWFTSEIVGQQIDMWVPISMQGVLAPNRQVLDDPQAYWLLFMGRRTPGVTFEQAQAGLQGAIRQILTEQAPNAVVVSDVARLEVPVTPGARGLSRVRTSYEAPLVILMVGVGLLLVIICANVANLLLARAVARTRETSVRLAIGASRARLVRQMLTESLLLALLGAVAGLLVGRWGSRLLLALAADGSPVLPLDTRIDVVALGFTMLLAMLAVVVFGLVPALRASRVDVAGAMRASAKSLTGGAGLRGGRNPLGRALIAGQVALSMVLLVGAALLVRSLRHVEGADTGVDREHLLVVDVDAYSRGYRDARLATLAQELGDRLRRIPGVTELSWSENGIFSGTESASNLGVPGFTAREELDSISYFDQVGPDFVRAIGGRLLRGRAIEASDAPGSAPVVLVNESFARFYFGDGDPTGTTIRISDSTLAQVVGVVADIKDQSLTAAARRRYYTAYMQRPLGSPGALRFLVRTTGEPARLVPDVRRTILAHDAQLPIDGIDPLSTLMRQSIREGRLLTRLASGFGLVALLLAAIGLYGVMSYAITRRTGEIGLRVALGAGRGNVIRLVLGDALRLVFIGVAVGVPLALASTRLLRNQLYGVTAADPVAMGVALAVLLTSAIVAALLPAVRASRVAPVVALREE
ncbi:MAG TPA: ABC transporter permease [Gemmatimonadaceae bacterium]|nr:ABC transporter permease [Gemmatimonadaceae bacterium]